jgi:hypothetical protein
MVADLVPLVIGILASPFPVIPVILLLLTPRATANAVSFLGGWAAGVAAGTALFVGLATVIDGFEETPNLGVVGARAARRGARRRGRARLPDPPRERRAPGVDAGAR